MTNSSITKSPFFETIMEKYDKFGKTITVHAFYKKYVIDLDPKLSYKAWNRFMKEFNSRVISKTESIIEKYANKEADENRMERSSLKNILTIADASLKDIIEHPEKLAMIPINMRMKWLFGAMKAKDSRMVALTKVQSEKRKTTIYEDMIKGAQYGEITEAEFDEEESAEVPLGVEDPKPITEKLKTVEFNPEEL